MIDNPEANQIPTFELTDTKPIVPVVILSTQAKQAIKAIGVLISKTLINSNINHNEFALVHNKEINNLKTRKQFIEDFKKDLFIKQCYRIIWSVEKNRESKNPKIVKTKNGKIILLSNYAVCGVKNRDLSKS